MKFNKFSIVLLKVLSILLILFWLLVNFFLVQNMRELRILGGGIVLFMLIPVFGFFLFVSKTYQKNILALTIIIIGFVTINYLNYYFSTSSYKLSEFIVILISVQPLILIFPPFFWLVYSRFKLSDQFKKQEDKKLLINLKAIDVFIFFLPSLALGIVSYLIFTDINTVNKIRIYNFIIGSFIFGSLIMIIYWRKIKLDQIILFLNENTEYYPGKVIKYTPLFFTCLFVFSYLLEIFRKNWLFWFECSFLMFLMYIHLWKFFKPRYPIPDKKEEKQPILSLPAISSPKSLMTIILLYVVALFWLFIIGQILKYK